MLFTQKMKLAELPLIEEFLEQGKTSPQQLFNFLKELKLEVNLPGIDEANLNLSYRGNILKISRDEGIDKRSFRSESGNIVAQSATTELALGIAKRMAKLDDPIVLIGETGTGKDLFARMIHQESRRRNNPFICIHCGMVDKKTAKQQLIDDLVEVGTGTLFLDDIQELGIEGQRILQKIIRNPVEQKYFRLITSTRVDLDDELRTGNFSAELLAIIRGGYIELLPLRERKEDIIPLLNYHTEQLCSRSSLEIKQFSPELLQMLEAYHWPGNIRELVNTVEQLLLTAQNKKTLFAKDLPAHIRIQTLETSAAQKKGL